MDLQKIKFYKYQGAGNDFVMIDVRKKAVSLDTAQIRLLCDRRFGIGADGLILLKIDEQNVYQMQYFNADGKESTMCGNGGRCFVRFVQDLEHTQDSISFEAIDGLHIGECSGDDIRLKMSDVNKVTMTEDYLFLDTGSPHHVVFCEEIDALDVKTRGAEIRYSEDYAPEGTNVNFVKIIDANHLQIRTYERGVEDETLACGTGVTAASLAFFASKKTEECSVQVAALGGNLQVDFSPQGAGFGEIYLSGPAKRVFEGEISLV